MENIESHKCENTDCDVMTTKPRFCSQKCAVTHSNKTRKRKPAHRGRSNPKCKMCSKRARGPYAKYCEEHKDTYKNRRNTNVRLKGLKRKRQYTRKGHMWLSSKIRTIAKNWYREILSWPCARCGYDKHVEMCHIREVRTFTDNDKIKVINARTNVVQLCRNCHWEMDNGHFKVEYDKELNVTVTELSRDGKDDVNNS